MWWALVILLVACRLDFNVYAPTPLQSFQAGPQPDGREREVRIAFEVDTAAPPVRLVIRRAAPDPPATCRDGDVVATLDHPESGSLVDRVPDGWNRVHGYRACAEDEAGRTTSTAAMVASGVRYANPGPHCMYPPCTSLASNHASQGTFVRATANLAALGAASGHVLAADFDGDDDFDVLVAGTAGVLIHRNAGGAFSAGFAVGVTPMNPVSAVTGDFDNDAIMDIVLANANGPSTFLRGRGDGAFDAERPIALTGSPDTFSVAAADINDDTFLDLVIIIYGSPDLVLLGDGTGAFQSSASLTSDQNASCVNCVTFADVDHDDTPELLIAYNVGTERVDVWRSRGDGTFDPPYVVPYDPALTPISIVTSDVDGDSNLDIVVGRSLNGGIYVAHGDGHGSFTTLAALATTTTSRCYGLAANDFDGDGDVDIVFSQDDTGTIGFLAGQPGGFASQVDLDGGSTWTTSNIDVADFDGDGLLDFVVGVDVGNSLVFFGR